ncbi:MAG: VWA domain-containing protein [Bacteroidetes bacterium]|nr:VWA domain-containing protein [Bacteroidota bacterium]
MSSGGLGIPTNIRKTTQDPDNENRLLRDFVTINVNTTYSRWIEGKSKRDEDRLQELVNLFHELLLRTSGDANEALQWMQYLDEQYNIFGPEMTFDMFLDELKRQGIVEDDENNLLKPTNKAVGNIKRSALLEIFRGMKKSPGGMHDTPHSGAGVERTSGTKGYTFGDQSTNIDFTRTLQNALRRSLRDEKNIGDSPLENLSMDEEDIEVYETEHAASCSTALLIDVSHSMILYGEDRITPAKKVAMALAELIRTKFPKDQLYVISFGDEAELISDSELPFLEVGPYHTNTRDGLRLARRMLRRSGNANKQIFMVTDGKPSAMFDDNGKLYKNSWGLDPKIINKTLDEAVALRREHIPITTFMIAHDPYLIDFVEEMTKANHGRAYYSGLNDLGQFVLVDYVRNRRRKV